jgi:hypothetical protein
MQARFTVPVFLYKNKKEKPKSRGGEKSRRGLLFHRL